MSRSPHGDGTDTQDGEILADLFDVLLQEILEGRTPDLASYLPDRPDLRERVQKTWALACSVAGRREPSRPVLGGYEIVRELGHGGMGTVYLARHQLLQREVAIKVLPHSLAMSPRAKQRFLEEAKALARLRHAQVVHIHRIIDQSEMLAFEMEFIGGPSLQTLIGALRKSDEPRSIETLAGALGVPAASLPRNTTEWCVRLGIDMARALAEVHRHGLVHRDVKPSNILLRVDGTPVLADFGLARFDDLDATQTGGFAGTPVYAAPERLRGGDADVDARADVYSLGVTLYELLALDPPFAGPSTTEVLRRIETGQQLPLRKQAPQVSRDLETVIQKAMEPDPQHRYATAEAFADDLERLLSLQPILARPAGPVRKALKFLGRQRRVVLAACAGALLVAAGAWPVFAHERALANVREQAAATLLEARTRLLSPESLHAAWSRAFSGASRQPLLRPAEDRAQVEALSATCDAYDRAAATDPKDDGTALERAVVRAAFAIRNGTERDTRSEVDTLAATMPPLTRRTARRFADGDAVKLTADAFQSTTTADRFAAGLLAFLLGDLATSHLCWSPIAEALQDQPLFDACFALQLASDGFPERAYQRLFHAARVFPGATSLALAMAESALAMGDTALAEHWLRSLPAAAADETAQSRRRLLEADLLAAAAQHDEAARIYRELIRVDKTDPTPVQRLATQALDGGDFDTAARLLRFIRQHWPDLALARLETARLALLRRDLPGYLAEVRHVMSQDLTLVSRGSASQLVEIVRLGGLAELHGRLLTEHQLRARASLHSTTLPLSHWLPASAVRSVEQSLATVAALDRAVAAAHRIDARPLAGALRSVWLGTMMLPGATLTMPKPVQAGLVLGIPALLRLPADDAGMLFVPFLRSLGDPLQVIDLRPIVQSRPSTQRDSFAQQMLLVRDLDGDTVDELCIASPAPPDEPEAGRVELRSLQDGSLLRTLRCDDPDVTFGRSIAVLGDVDGDLCDDVLVGAPQARPGPIDRGEVHLCSGRTGHRIRVISREIPSFGVSVAALDDVDGDGVRDFVAGASPASLSSGELGRAFVCSGRTGEELRELVAERGGTWFGGCVVNVGDVDADGHDDVLVTGNYGGAPGLATVFAPGTGAALMTFGDDATGTDFGLTALGMGDVDGDRHADFAIAAPALTGRGRPPARVQIFSGRTGRVHVELTGDDPGDGFGSALCLLPFWKGADRAVIAVATRRGGPFGSGYVRVFYASDGRPTQTFAGNPGLVRFGQSLADLGDLDGDGMRDLAIPGIARSGVGFVSPMSWAALKQPAPRGR